MSGRIGIFDLFSYTVPGALFLIAVVLLLHQLDVLALPASAAADLSAIQVALLGTLCYLIGLIVSPLSWTPWYRLFGSSTPGADALERVKGLYPEVTVHFQPEQWPVLQAYVAHHDRDLSLAVDKLRAIYIMLRSVSLAFILFLLNAIVYAFEGAMWSGLGAGLLCLALSALAAKGSHTYSSWTYSYTFELVIAKSLDHSDFVTKVDDS